MQGLITFSNCHSIQSLVACRWPSLKRYAVWCHWRSSEAHCSSVFNTDSEHTLAEVADTHILLGNAYLYSDNLRHDVFTKTYFAVAEFQRDILQKGSAP